MADFGVGEILASLLYVGEGVGGMVADTAIAAAPYAMAGSSMYSAYSVMNTPKMPSAEPSADTTEAAAYAQAESMKKRRGAASTILTSPLGVTNQPNVKKTTLGD